MEAQKDFHFLLFKLLFIFLLNVCFLVRSNMLKIGHRGAAGVAPENTLLSFSKAIDKDVDMVELDVYKCASGEIVVIHDEDVSITTNGKGNVHDLSFAQLKLFDAGKGQKIPTLKEVLELVERRCKVNIELKGGGTTDGVARIIEEYVNKKGWNYNDFLVTSFYYFELQKFLRKLTEVPVGMIVYDIDKCDLDKMNLDYLIIDKRFVSSKIINSAHKKQTSILVYTINSEEERSRLRLAGVDGAFTDYP